MGGIEATGARCIGCGEVRLHYGFTCTACHQNGVNQFGRQLKRTELNSFFHAMDTLMEDFIYREGP